MIDAKNLRIDAWDIRPWLVETRRTLHRRPELGLEEERTADFIEARLEEMGVERERRQWRARIYANVVMDCCLSNRGREPNGDEPRRQRLEEKEVGRGTQIGFEVTTFGQQRPSAQITPVVMPTPQANRDSGTWNRCPSHGGFYVGNHRTIVVISQKDLLECMRTL